MENFNSFKGLNEKELVEINGGGLAEDVGYVAHAVVDGVCAVGNAIADAAEWVGEQASAAWDWITG